MKKNKIIHLDYYTFIKVNTMNSCYFIKHKDMLSKSKKVAFERNQSTSFVRSLCN